MCHLQSSTAIITSLLVQVELVTDNKHRPQDLRTLALRGAIDSKSALAYAQCSSVAQASGTAWERLLMAGCVIAQEMRAALKVVTGSDVQPVMASMCIVTMALLASSAPEAGALKPNVV